MIKIRLSAGLRSVAGSKTVEVQIKPGATVRDLLHSLHAANAALANHILTPSGDLVAGMLLIVRGQHIDFQQGLDTAVHEVDEVMLVPPLSGG
ncbi:MAG TPA: ubiquitin-like small modifier protein 1 [Aggregatilineaceae bacterium]|nr:ubiquitin-like small modifier protein 1 [Aggregatilineaceae bacterium]